MKLKILNKIRKTALRGRDDGTAAICQRKPEYESSIRRWRYCDHEQIGYRKGEKQ